MKMKDIRSLAVETGVKPGKLTKVGLVRTIRSAWCVPSKSTKATSSASPPRSRMAAIS